MENKKDVSHRKPMIMTLSEGQQSPERSKKEIYQVDGNKNVGVLVECDNCGFIDESTRSKSKSSSSSSQEKDEDVTATKSSKIAYTITYYFKCPNCSAEKTLLEHEQNDNDDEDEEDEDDDDDEEEGDPWSANLSNIKIRTPKDSFNRRFMCLFPPPIDRTPEVAPVMDLVLNDNAERHAGSSEILSLFTRIMHKSKNAMIQCSRCILGTVLQRNLEIMTKTFEDDLKYQQSL